MQNTTFGATLRELRERNNMTVKQVIAKLKNYGINITDKTLYSYENDKRAVSADMLLALCQIYKCSNILETFSDFVPDYSIPDDSEWKLIERYRALDDTGRAHVETILSWESDRVREIDTLQEPSAIYTYMRKIACAGTGFYFDDIPTETIKAPYMEGADFIIGVNGDSMEPDYYDGDLLYVKKTEMINYGDVGIFTINNECFLKEFGRNGLISRNKKYKDIPANEDVRLIGKIIGKVPE